MVLVEVVGVAVGRDCKGQLEVGAEEAAAVAFPSNRGVIEEQFQRRSWLRLRRQQQWPPRLSEEQVQRRSWLWLRRQQQQWPPQVIGGDQ